MTMEAYAALLTQEDSLDVELWNAARLKAYVDAGFKPNGVQVRVSKYCDGLVSALSDPAPVYTTPSDPDNPAPWYSPADPSSADFAGLMILGIEGWETAPFTRTLTDRISHGAVLGRGRYAPRTMVVDALLIGRTCCSLQSGLRWLTSVLDKNCASPQGRQMEYFECCPGSACDSSDPTPTDYNDHRRILRQTGLTVGVAITEKIGNKSCANCKSGCTTIRVTFTLASGDPFSYGDPLCQTHTSFRDPAMDDCLKFTQDCTDPCAVHDCPIPDPYCPTPALPPSLPGSTSCQCEPLTVSGSCSDFTIDDIPAYQAAVPLLTITTGTQALRRVKVRFYNNPLGLPSSELSDCEILGQFIVSYIAPGTTFTADGRDRKFYLSCTGGRRSNATRLVAGVDGPFRWPVLECGSGYTICLTADGSTFPEPVGHESGYTLCLVPRSAA